MVTQYPHKLYIDQPESFVKDENGNWVSEGTPFDPHIGDVYHGGIIFHIDSTGKHGLIMATSDQSASTRWHNGSNVLTGANREDVGRGDENTDDIIKAQGFGSYAAAICRLYNGGGYTDWQLPTTGDMQLIKDNLFSIGVGNLNTAGNYWTSVEGDTTPIITSYIASFYQANEIDFIAVSSKDALCRVRAVRAF